jgi:hypothetical protein
VFLSKQARSSVFLIPFTADLISSATCTPHPITAFYFMLFENICTLGLLECFQDDPWRADFEKQAFASCQHPFIVNLDYAFQTDSLAIMVLGLATAGDLQKVRCGCHAVVSVCSSGDLECGADALRCITDVSMRVRYSSMVAMCEWHWGGPLFRSGFAHPASSYV